MYVVNAHVKGSGSIFLVVRQRILWKVMALASCEIFEFNFIHDYDVIIIGHECSNKVTGMLSLLTSC